MSSQTARIDELIFMLRHVAGLGASDLPLHAALTEPTLRASLLAGGGDDRAAKIMQAAHRELRREISPLPSPSSGGDELSSQIIQLEQHLEQLSASALHLWLAGLQDRVEQANDTEAARLTALLRDVRPDGPSTHLPHAEAYAAFLALLRSEARMRQGQPGTAAISTAVLEAARLLDAAAIAWRELIEAEPALVHAARAQLHAMCETCAHGLMWLRMAGAAEVHLAPEQHPLWTRRANAFAARLPARLALQLAQLRSLDDMARALAHGIA